MKPSEVTHINRQKYMAELSKLLAFMFKEDKEDILAQYNKMLDETDDEQALLESFGSPTKLAVTISRTYKRSERKLAVEADSKEDKPEATEHIIVTPVKKEKEKPSVTDTGLSYADIIEEIRREKAAEEGVEYKPMFFDEPEQPTAEETPVEEIPEVEPVEETPEESSEEEQAAEPSPDEEEPAPEEAETEEPEASSDETEEAPENEATVVEETQGEKAEAEPEETPVEEAADEAEQPEEPTEEPTAEAELVFEEIESVEIPEETVRYKTNAALLILYLIFAIPIGLVLLALALAVTLALLGLGVLVIVIGARFIAFAFAKLVIFADVMFCAGAALIAFAVALIILWLGILMLVRGIKGVVGGVVSLGRKFCVKEVPVNG